MIPCSGASSSLSSGSNINSGGSFSYCGPGSQSYSNVNLSGGSIYICGNVTINSGNFNSGRIFVACGGSLTFANTVTLNSNVGIVNYGNVQINGNLNFQNGNCYFYNEGFSSKLNVTGDFTFPGNQVVGYLRNKGKVNVGGTLNLGAGGLICAGAGSVISIGNFIYGGSNCNSNDIAAFNLRFAGTGLESSIFRYSGTAVIRGRVTNSANIRIYRAGSAPSFPCSTSPSSGWGSGTVITTSIPALPAEPSQAGCLVNGNVNCNSVAVLPVELLYFKTDCEENKVRLDWATASERNNQYWTVERSNDLVNIEKIGEIAGAGNSSQLLNYTFEDANTWGETAYYRITQHDYDGNTESFEWVSIHCGLSADFNVFPNPSTGVFYLTTSNQLEDPVHYQLADLGGKIILEGNTALTQGKPATLNLENLNQGIYYLKIQSGEKSWTTKLVKQ